MRGRRYQIFVSSTFTDLVDERRAILRGLLEREHLPLGMELFPAADESTWPLIAKLIRLSDYFLLIVGGRYGTRDSRGLGYTEKEYRYAARIRKPVIALLVRDPERLPEDKTDGDAEAWRRLSRFRTRIEREHPCAYWNSARDLSRTFVRALAAEVRRHPAAGWVRWPQPRRAGGRTAEVR